MSGANQVEAMPAVTVCGLHVVIVMCGRSDPPLSSSDLTANFTAHNRSVLSQYLHLSLSLSITLRIILSAGIDHPRRSLLFVRKAEAAIYPVMIVLR